MAAATGSAQLSPQTPPIAPSKELRPLLNSTAIPWIVSKSLQKRADETPPLPGSRSKKVLVLPSDPELNFILSYFFKSPALNFDIRSVHYVENPTARNDFEAHLLSQENEATNPEFFPNWEREDHSVERHAVHCRWKEASKSFNPFNIQTPQGVKTSSKTFIFPLWHGTSAHGAESIARSGFAYFGKTKLSSQPTTSKNTDKGYFGSGIYFTPQPTYAEIFSSMPWKKPHPNPGEGHLMLAWVSMREPLPVVGTPGQSDTMELGGKGAHANYNAHFIPVEPLTPGNPMCHKFLPALPGRIPMYDEYVVFRPAQTLAAFWIELQPDGLSYMSFDDPVIPTEELIRSAIYTLRIDSIFKNPLLKEAIFSLLNELFIKDPKAPLNEKEKELFKDIYDLASKPTDEVLINKIVAAYPPLDRSEKSLTASISPHVQGLLFTRAPYPHFVGRRDLIGASENLEAWGSIAKHLLATERRYSRECSFFALCGDGGFGKSETAISFANAYAEHFSFIWSISCQTEAIRISAYRELADALGLILEEKITPSEIVKRVHHKLETTPWTKPWLIIYDNAEEMVPFPERGGALLVTSRQSHLWQEKAPVEAIQTMHTLQREESILLLKKVTGLEASDAMQDLAETLGDWPLALTMAGALAGPVGGLSIEELNQMLKSEDRKALLKELKSDAERGRYHTETLREVWKISRAQLLKREGGDRALAWLEICAYLSPVSIPSKWVDTWMKTQGVEGLVAVKRAQTLGMLVGHSLVSYKDPTKGAISLHPLKQEIIRHQVDDDKGHEVLVQAGELVGSLGEKLGTNYEDWENVKEWEPHGESLLPHRDRFSQKVECNLFLGLNTSYYIAARYDDALSKLNQALKIKRELTGGHPDSQVAAILHAIGSTQNELGQYEQALRVLTESLDVYRSLQKDQPDSRTFITLGSMGIAYKSLGQYEQALDIYNQQLSLVKSIYAGKPHPHVADVWINTGNVRLDMGEYAEALKAHSESYRICCLVFSDRLHPKTALTLHNIGLVHKNLGQYDEAQKAYTESLEMELAIYGNQPHPSTALLYMNMGLLHGELGQRVKALEAYEKSYLLYHSLFGDKPHPKVAMLLHNMGLLQSDQGQYTEALETYNKSLQMKQAIYDKKPHPSTASTLGGIGMVYFKLEQYSEALKSLRESLQMRRFIHQSQVHPDIASSLGNIGMVHSALGQLTEALEAQEESLRMKRAIYGDQPHVSIAISLMAIGNIYASKDQNAEALEAYKQSLEIYRAAYGQPHPRTASCLYNIGNQHTLLGEHAEALEAYKQSLEIQRIIYCDQPHTDITYTLINMSNLLNDLGQHAEALEALHECLEIEYKIYGREPHRELAKTLNAIGNTLWDLKDYIRALQIFNKSNQMKRNIYGDLPHPDIAMTLFNIGGTHLDIGHPDIALQAYKESLEIYRAYYVDQPHPKIAKTLYKLGYVSSLMGDSAAAFEYYWECLEMQRSIYSDDAHPDIARTLAKIEQISEAMG
jgi:tetratricopeptide (TPR) repeat protein